MKNRFLKCLKIVLIVAFSILITLLVFGLVMSLDWPWWVALFILLAIVGVFAGCFFIRKIWLKHREQQFVQQVIEQDEKQLKTLMAKDQRELKDLQDKWKDAVASLNKSYLKKSGNPLYVLPWYLVIGESGSGKTTSINSARLSSPFGDVNRTSGISGTRNCDWWFFEQAIILDTAGRYTVPIDDEKDKDEWVRFLNLLAKYKRREPINGIIVTIAADKLLEADNEVMADEGRNIRQRIDELMMVLGFKFPIYVLVTKCDLIQGMTSFCDHLPEESLDQPMGVINQELSTDVVSFVDQAFNTIGERLRNLRLLMLHQTQSDKMEPGILLFPDEFQDLKNGLESFVKGAFTENPYQEASIFRGLFFSSGRQEGSPFSRFLNSLGLIEEKEVLAGTNIGLFLHDFFSKVIPKDRELFAPTKRAAEWNLLTKNIGLISWVLLAVAACGMLSWSFVRNKGVIMEIREEFLNSDELIDQVDNRSFRDNLYTINDFKTKIVFFDEKNDWGLFPRFGLNESINVVRGLKEKYCKQFNGFLNPVNKLLTDDIMYYSDYSDEEYGQRVIQLVRLINLLQEGDNDQYYYVPLLSRPNLKISSEEEQMFDDSFTRYLDWRRKETGYMNQEEIKEEIKKKQRVLTELLNLKKQDYRWIYTWVNMQNTLPYLTLNSFWGGALQKDHKTKITYAFSTAGKKLIDAIFEEIKSAHNNPGVIEYKKNEFDKLYVKECFLNWKEFATDFPKGKELLRNREEWQLTVTKIKTGQEPYAKFLNTIFADLNSLYRSSKDRPLWLQQVFQYHGVISQKYFGQSIGKVYEKGKNIMSRMGFGKDKEKIVDSNVLTSYEAYKKYNESLSGISSQLLGLKNRSYQITKDVFIDNQADSMPQFLAAYAALKNLKTHLSMMNERPFDDVFRKLVEGPFGFLWQYALMETACYLQMRWDDEVISETQRDTDQQEIQFLLSENGPVRQFINGTAKPFLKFTKYGTKKGYYAKEVENLPGSVPFKESFFEFVNEGLKALNLSKENYRIVIEGLPTHVNAGTPIKPHATHLELQCKDSTQKLSNLNFPVTKTFDWSPEGCGDVTLKIDVENMSLKKQYIGTHAFLKFLRDFSGGQRIFKSEEFSVEQEDYLERLGISSITVKYKFSGYKEILDWFKSLPEEVPGSIVTCLER